VAETNLNKYLRPELNKVGDAAVKKLKASLVRLGHVNTEKLLESIRYQVVIKSNTDFEIRLFWTTRGNAPRGIVYGDFLNTGNQNTWLSEEGRKRLVAWVRRRMGVGGKKGNRIAYAIQKSWVKGTRYPSKKFGGKGWANRALQSVEQGETKKILSDALTTAYQKYLDEIFKNAQRKKR